MILVKHRKPIVLSLETFSNKRLHDIQQLTVEVEEEEEDNTKHPKAPKEVNRPYTINKDFKSLQRLPSPILSPVIHELPMETSNEVESTDEQRRKRIEWEKQKERIKHKMEIDRQQKLQRDEHERRLCTIGRQYQTLG